MTQGSGTEGDDQLREIKEAQDACEAALTSLGEAQRAVDSARSWGTYDTWLGGGLFSSLMKHDRIDDAEGYMRAVDAALDRLRHELADVRMEGAALGGVGVSDLNRTLDVWFDNFFSDMAVQSRLNDADHRLDTIGEALVSVRRALHDRQLELVGRPDGS
jgi:hypothetical protein